MEVKIIHDKHGYYTLYINGNFEGNYDTYEEAKAEMEATYVNGRRS